MTHAGDLYTFLVTDLLTGLVIDDVELSSMHWSEVYDRPGAGQATARLDDPKTTQANFEAWQNGLWAIKDGDIRWGGFMGGIQPQGGTRVINIPLFGFEEYLRYQLVTGTGGMVNADLIKGGKAVRWDNVDQFEIVRDLVDHGQQVENNQSLGLSVVWDSLSGVLRDDQIAQWEAKYVGERIEEMSDNINGFDWYYEYYWDGNTPRARIKLKYPRGPRFLNILFEYDQDPGKCNIIEYDVNGGTRPACRLLGLGDGNGEEMIYYYSLHNHPHPGNVNYDDVYSTKQVKEMATLIEQTDGLQEIKDMPHLQVNAKLDPELDPGYTEYRAGDAINLRIDDGYVQINGRYTVVSKNIVLSKQHDEEVTVDLTDILIS